ncbi:uncharacterized protein LOC143800062 [Ranitomeya variabilis]|uniref:uncharacterized protein LOC143800062 n=1 Tax=Ranitomeya variabilis TaxID=490064 RepID=UPI004056CED2
MTSTDDAIISVTISFLCLLEKSLQTMMDEVVAQNKNEKLSPAGTDLLKGLTVDDSLLDEVVEEIMSPNLSLLPQKMNSGTARQMQRRRLEASIDHTILLIEEEIILEVTSDVAKQVATDVFKRAMLSSDFESHFNSEEVQEYFKSTNPLNF